MAAAAGWCPDDAVVPAFEDGYGLVDAVVVVGRGNVMDAGRIAVVQMVLQAGPVTRHDPARADMVGPLHQFQDPVDGRRVGKGAEVAGAVAADAAGHENPRIVLLDGDLDVGIGLVVAEHDVVAGMVLLDEVVF